MKTVFNQQFLKDIDKLPSAKSKSAVADAILAVEAAQSLAEMSSVKKLKGFKNAYRIRSGDFRIGMLLTAEAVEFVRVLHRKEIYRLFP